MNILVTGAAGFIGAHLCNQLLQKGHDVWGVDNFITGSPIKIQTLSQQFNFHFLDVNIVDQKFTDFFLDLPRLDQIYHLACPTGVPNIKLLALAILDTCSLGTTNVLKIAKRHRASLVFTSSSEIYGDPLVFPQSESYTGNVNPLGDRGPYEEGKRFAETLIVSFGQKFHLGVKIVRLFNVYGPGMLASDSRVIPQFIHRALTNQPIVIYGDGRQIRTFCFVNDIIAGLQLVMKVGAIGTVYNLGSDEELSILELAELVTQLTDSKSQISFTPHLVEDHHRRQPDLAKIKRLGWQTLVNLPDGLLAMIAKSNQTSVASLPETGWVTLSLWSSLSSAKQLQALIVSHDWQMTVGHNVHHLLKSRWRGVELIVTTISQRMED